MKIKILNRQLLLILLIAAIIRLWNLSNVPPHLTPDEAALGYNAYSILKTGKDEYGQFMPIIFKSFGDYKPGLYIYTAVPFVLLFGLNEFAVRLPSALAGIIAVWLVYLIVGEFIKHKYDGFAADGGYKKIPLEILAAFTLSVNPWHIYFSRGAWEANLSLSLTLAGIYFFLRSLQSKHALILASLFLSLTLITYQGAKMSTLIVMLIIIIVFRKQVGQWLSDSVKSTLLAPAVVGIIIAMPILLSLFQGKTGRLNVFSVFSYPRKPEDIQEILGQGNENKNGFNYYFFHSETLNLTRGVLGRWYNHLSGRFLFFEGDWQNPRHSAPNHGMLMIIDLVFVVSGFIFLARNKAKLTAFIVLWLLLSPLPGALSRDQVHAVRSLNMVIPITLLTAGGYALLLEKIRNIRSYKTRYALYGVIAAGFALSFAYFTDAYFIHLPGHNSKYWEYGYKQIVDTVTPVQKNFNEIKVQQSFAQPYIYFLFYQKYDPAKYQLKAKLTASEYKGDVGYIENLDNVCFCAIDWPANRSEHGKLIVADSIRIPETEVLGKDSVVLLKEIKYLNGETAFRVVEIK